MDKRTLLLIGLSLILAGIAELAFTLAIPALGLEWWSWVGRLWPLAIVSVGQLLMVFPFLIRGRGSVGLAFILGLPITVTGVILLLASVLDQWSIWERLWPLEVLAVALAFLLMAFYSRQSWPVIPAALIGVNGLTFQFCALTGLWDTWAVLWTVEPLSIGLVLLALYYRSRSTWLLVTGLLFCGLSGLGLFIMMTVLSTWWLIGLPVTAVLLLSGLALLIWAVVRYPPPRLA